MQDIQRDLILAALKDQKDREERRKRDSAHRLMMLSDDYETMTKDRMNGYLSDSVSMELIEKYINTAQNVYKKIINRLSRIYKKAPVRVFSQNGKQLPRDQVSDAFDAYNQAAIDRKMKQINSALNAVNDVLIGPVYRNGKLCLDILTPDQVTVVEDDNDPSVMAGVIIGPKIRWVDGKDQRYWAVWTETQHYLEVEVGSYQSGSNGQVMMTVQEAPAANNQEMINPYGVIPFIDIHRFPTEASFWNETAGSDLYQFNLVVACRNTLLDYAAAWQSFKQLAVQSDEKPVGNITLSPSSVLWGTRNAEWSVLDLHANFDQIRGDLKSLVSAVSQNYGVSLDSFNSPSEQSGVALKINNQELIDSWNDQLEIFRDAEVRLWDMIKLVSEVDQINSSWAGLDIDIKFASMGITDEKQEIENDLVKMANGLASPGAVYMKYNDAVTSEAEAEKLMAENIKKYNDIRPSPLKYGIISSGEEGQDGEGEE